MKLLRSLNWKRILLAAFLVTIVSFVIGFVTCGWLFNWVYALEPTNIWKSAEAMNTMWFVWMNLAGFLFAIILTVIYAIIRKNIPGKGAMNGVWFGVIIWLVSSLPMEFSNFMLMNIATGYVIYSLIMGLVNSIIKGVIIALIYK